MQDVLGRPGLTAEDIDQAGRFLQKHLPSTVSATNPLSVLLLGQCTTSWLATAVTAVAFGQGMALKVKEGGYDAVLQDLSTFRASMTPPDVLVLLPWHQRLLRLGDDPANQRIDDEVAYWRQAWELVSRWHSTRIIQIGYDWVTPGPFGLHLGGEPSATVALIREVNSRLRSARPDGCYFLDLEQASGWFGRNAFYDPRRYTWTKQPFSEDGIVWLAQCLSAAIRAVTTGPKKVLVVDLDNTLWGGVVGETGPLDVVIGEGPDGGAYRAFQCHLKELARRGILLAMASKNNPEDVREVFTQNTQMMLGLDDFAAMEIGWNPKSIMLTRLASSLNLSLDSFVFFDDNPAEREQIRQSLPEVTVVEVPEEPAEYVRALEAGLWFEAFTVTEEDRHRAEQYQEERVRQEYQQSCHSLDEYLASLEMQADVRAIDEADLPRVVQLLAKTNQFNLTTRRHTREDVLNLLAQPRAIGLTLRLKDRFGDHGLVAVLLAVPLPSGSASIRIDTWLMSCRVIGRTVEQFLLQELLRRARVLGYRRIIGEYLPTAKNKLVEGLYQELGFRAVPIQAGTNQHELDLESAQPPATFVRSRQ